MFFTVEKIEKQLKEIQTLIHRDTCDIPRFKYFEFQPGTSNTEALRGAECPEFDDRFWQEFRVGETWGGYDVLAWFRTWISLPPDFKDKKLALRFLVGPRDGGGSTAESMLYVNGTPLQAFDVWHTEAWLPPEFLQEKEIFIALKAWSGVLEVPERRRFTEAQLIWVDEATEDFYYLCNTMVKAVRVLDENDLRRMRLIQAMNEAFHLIDFAKPRSPAFYASISLAQGHLKEVVNELHRTPEIKPKVTGIGHAHIDMAWLWRLSHSREKAARTFSTALHLMRQYPEYHFLHSTPQAYKFLKEDYPEIYSQVKEKIAAGRWEITGGMWVEADTNLPSGESLVRQFLLGKRFVRDEFGVEMNILWLPDVFGYSWALPQIVKKSGLKYFLTTKISWSQFNRFPYDTFRWRGIDGTELLTHFVTTPEPNSPFYTYNGQLQPAEVKGVWDNYRQKDLNDECLALFGWGDGGGGPTKEMLESARVLQNLPGLPQVELGKAEPYFERLAARVEKKDLPVWDGELYLEYHRGTFTSQAYNKRANRKSEILYHDAEWLSVISDLLTGQENYPARSLQTGWEMILLNQFHDILPGSSIRQVYEDSQQDYMSIKLIGEQALEQAQKALVDQIGSNQDGIIVFNSLSWKRNGLVEIPWSGGLASNSAMPTGESASRVQVTEIEGERKLLIEVKDVPALGYKVFPLAQEAQTSPVEEGDRATGFVTDPRDNGADPAPGDEISITPDCLENQYYRIHLNQCGQLTSIWDKTNCREVLAPGSMGNVFQAFEDKPMAFDAWDIDIYYLEKMKEIDELVDVQVEEAGPLRGTLLLRWRFYDSILTQHISLYRHTARIDFRTQVDWKEEQTLLKVAFPVGVRATRATYDIQFGNIERPTHWNTSWDFARFEAVGHKWVDLSEGNYGVSLLNDCKYGYDVKDNVLRLTLIKSAIRPDKLADKGQHFFTYSLLPHAGDWRSSDVVQQAYDLNYPLLTRRAPAQDDNRPQLKRTPDQYQFAGIDTEGVILETVKRAEDGEGWIIRVYEYKQCHANQVSINFAKPIRKAVECNLVEEDDRTAVYEGQHLRFAISPYEIKTFKIWF